MNKENHYIFLSPEGFTFHPGSEAAEPDIENLQVIGFAYGDCPEAAFCKLLRNNSYLIHTSFDELICLKLAEEAEEEKKYFYISDYR